MEFATEPDCCSMVDYMKAHPEKPILVLRTFSKYYAMAGLRVGYALGSEELIGIMRKCSASCNLNVCAQKAAVAGWQTRNIIRSRKPKSWREENIWKKRWQRLAAGFIRPSRISSTLIPEKILLGFRNS